MAEEAAGRRAKDLAEAGRSTVITPVITRLPEKEITRPEAPEKTWTPPAYDGIFCKNCGQWYPASAKKDFICSVCQGREFATEFPY